jgi:hypothetical protein
LKDDFEGHSNSWANNVVALDTNPALHNGYDGTVGTPGNVPYVKEGFEHTLRSNYLVYFGNDWEYAKPICDGTGKSIMGNNSVFTTNGAAHLCGFSLADWQKMGNDPGTSLAAWNGTTVVHDLISRGKQVLGL